MKTARTENDILHLLRIIAALWLGYTVALAVLDRIFYPRPLYLPLYYAGNGVCALGVLALALATSGRELANPQAAKQQIGKLAARFLLPLAIVLMAAVPTLLTHFAVSPDLPPPAPPGVQARPEFSALRLMPVLFMALVLTAWRYRWLHVVAFSLGAALLNLALRFLAQPGMAGPVLPPLTVLVIQLVSFLAVGYVIRALMRRLRAQTAALQAANRQLAQHASTLETLTITRERNRVARELHDTLAHTLSGLSVQLETVKAYWDVKPETARGLLDNSLAATRAGLQETRRALKALRATPLEDLGLLLALRREAESAAARGRLRLELELPASMGSTLALAPGVEQAIYRVAQEAIANVLHHANARTLAVRLAVDDAGVALAVRDDGSGFDPAQAPSAGHFGLAGMRERAAIAGGTLTVTSAPGEGTTVTLQIHDLYT